MRTRKLIGVGVILLGSWFALTPAVAQTKDAASFDRHLYPTYVTPMTRFQWQ